MIAVGYKIFAAILSRRLKDAGAEGRIWPTQFGFRSGCGCADALFISRRKVENAWARKNGNLLLLALDWAKVFDSISPTSLVNAMSRFGIPYHFCSVVCGIYNGRHLMVRDGDGLRAGRFDSTRLDFSPKPRVLWHFSRLSFIPLSVFHRPDVAHSRC